MRRPRFAAIALILALAPSPGPAHALPGLRRRQVEYDDAAAAGARPLGGWGGAAPWDVSNAAAARKAAGAASDKAIRAALSSGDLDCPAFVLGGGKNKEDPMLPFLDGEDCDGKRLARLHFANGSAIVPGLVGACRSEPGFDVLSDEGRWLAAPATEILDVPAGVRDPKLTMDFYVSRKGVDGLRRSNCESSDRAGEAPEWYTAWLQGKLLRLSVSCDDGGVEGYLYFVWSRPQTEGTTDEGNQITAFKCKGGRAVAVSSIGGGNDDEESGEEDGGDGSGTDDEAEEPTKTKPAVPVDPYTPGPEAEAMPAVMPTDAGAPTDVSTDTPIVLLATPMPLGSGPADSGAAPEDEDDDSSPSDGAKPLAIPVVAGSGDGDGTDTSQAAPKVGQGDDPSVPTPTAIEDSTGDPVPVAAPAGADHPPCPTLPVTTNGRCGEDYGARCPDGFCCSAWGWCQDDGGEDSADWCGPGCQIGFGKCFYQGPVADVCRSAREFTMTSVSASTTVYAACTTMPESKDGRCGRNAGTRCADGTCCSQWGWCQNNGENDGQAWCGDGCQVGYGKCFMGHGVPPRDFVCPTGLEPTPTEYSLTWVSKSTPVYMACTGVPLSGDGRCGKNTGTRCREGTCCSEWGYCQDDGGDSGESWCGTGCQLGFGKCFVGTAPLRTDFACPSSAPAEPTSGDWAPTRISRATPVYQACPTIPVSEDGRCGKEFGTRCPAGICCSQWGWCQDDGGDSGVSWCGAGCQLGYGKCFVGKAPLSTAWCGATAASEPTAPAQGTTAAAPETTAAALGTTAAAQFTTAAPVVVEVTTTAVPTTTSTTTRTRTTVTTTATPSSLVPMLLSADGRSAKERAVTVAGPEVRLVGLAQPVSSANKVVIYQQRDGEQERQQVSVLQSTAGTGNFTFDTKLEDGTYAFWFESFVGTSEAYKIVVDSTVPEDPVLKSVNGQDPGSFEKSDTAVLTFEGTGGRGSTIHVYADDGSSKVKVGSGPCEGEFKVTTESVDDGEYVYTVRAESPGGKESEGSASVLGGKPVRISKPEAGPSKGCTLFEESFAGASLEGPQFIALGDACLSGMESRTRDPYAENNVVGCNRDYPVAPKGFLQLTSAANWQTGAILLNDAIRGGDGFEVTVDLYQYGGNGADGIAFFLVDGEATLTEAGGFGGSLGYAQYNNGRLRNGVSKGYIGVGFDAFGNFAKDTEGRGSATKGGNCLPSNRTDQYSPNSITIRGPGDGTLGYCWLGTNVLPQSGTNQRFLRAGSVEKGRRTARITLTPAEGGAAKFRVEMDYGDGAGYRTEHELAAPTPIPSSFKIGLTSGTGAQNDMHLVSNLVVRSRKSC